MDLSPLVEGTFIENQHLLRNREIRTEEESYALIHWVQMRLIPSWFSYFVNMLERVHIMRAGVQEPGRIEKFQNQTENRETPSGKEMEARGGVNEW